MRIIIIGATTAGIGLAEYLVGSGHAVTLIDTPSEELAQIGNRDRRGIQNAKHIPDGTVQAAIGDSIGLYITAKNGRLTAVKGFADKPSARLVFKDLKTAQGVLSGKTDTYAAIAVGDLVMKGFIPMIEHMNPILESVSGYLS